MNTITTTNILSGRAVQISPHLHIAISFTRPIEPRHALFALKQGDVKLAYEEKYSPFKVVALEHADEVEIASMEAYIDLHQECFHQGQFYAGQTCDLVMDGNVLATATIVEVKHPALTYWDWKQVPAYLKDGSAHFDAEQLDCFLINLEFALLDLGFIRDYAILKPKAGNYSLEVRLYSSLEALNQEQAWQVLDALYLLCYSYYQLKPTFYQLDAKSEHFENFECSFIIGEGSQYVTGRLIVI